MSRLSILRLVGLLLVAVGTVWALQGAGILPGSVMSGQRQWLFIGIALVATGLAVLIRARRGYLS